MICDRGNNCIEVVGPMTVEHAKLLAKEGVAALRRTDTVFDLSAVTRVDSTALAIILSWMRAAQMSGQKVLVINAPENLMSLAELYDLAALLPLNGPSHFGDIINSSKHGR